MKINIIFKINSNYKNNNNNSNNNIFISRINKEICINLSPLCNNKNILTFKIKINNI